MRTSAYMRRGERQPVASQGETCAEKAAEKLAAPAAEGTPPDSSLPSCASPSASPAQHDCCLIRYKYT